MGKVEDDQGQTGWFARLAGSDGGTAGEGAGFCHALENRLAHIRLKQMLSLCLLLSFEH
jgi:hypothetical protein